MAEVVVNVAIEQLVSAEGWLQKEISLLKGVKPKLENMNNKLQIIQRLVADAENQSIKKENVKLWLEKLKDVSYDMDDVLDEWSTRVQILERDEAEEIVGSSSSPTTCCSFKKLNCFSSVKQLPWRREIALRINDINDRIDLVFLEMKDFELATKVAIKVATKVRTTTSSIDETRVYGRADDMAFLLSEVLSMDTEQEKSPQVISIVGAGGIGKTTLAQMIYNNEIVKQKFGENRIWVYVSNPLDEVKVARDILDGLQVDHTKLNYLETLHQSIEKSLSKVKFLLVLDDVWEEDSRKWDTLSIRLNVGDPDSRILVTTRKQEVGRTMGTKPSNIVMPRLISDLDCWHLIKQTASIGGTENDEFEDIGKEIAKKCKGLPLAAKALGGLLMSKHSIQEWREMLDSEIWELEQAEVELFPHIFLSYQELPSMMKRCFLILALYPIDTYLKVEQVIRLWMALGYLNTRTNQGDIVKTGQQYLKFLLSRAFLHEEETRISMHDIMHDFALHLMGEEILSIMVDDGGTSESTSMRCRESSRVRHLIINGEINQTSIGFYLGKLRTCILLNVPPNVTGDLVKQLKMVRLLKLKHCNLKQVPESIMKFIHLRMLVLSDNPLVELPETIGDLFNLQHLFLEGISSLSSLPRSLGKLVNLISLIPSDLALEKAPESVEKLIYLQSLDRVQIGAGKGHLGLLKDLNQLRGVLEIEFKSDYDAEVDAKKAAIGRKKHLTGLALYFKRYNVTDGVVAALKPHPKIQSLKIIGLLPSWITSLHHLKDLHIENEQISTLPPLWELEYLEKIIISHCNSLETIGREFLGIDGWLNGNVCAFPSLVEFIISHCDILTKFEDLKQEDKGKITVMPKLGTLKITRCPKFRVQPSRLFSQFSSLKVLELPYPEGIIFTA